MTEQVEECRCRVGNFVRSCPYATLKEKLAEEVRRKEYEALKNL